MPLNRAVTGNPIVIADVNQIMDLLTGVMTDQTVNVTSGKLQTGGRSVLSVPTNVSTQALQIGYTSQNFVGFAVGEVDTTMNSCGFPTAQVACFCQITYVSSSWSGVILRQSSPNGPNLINIHVANPSLSQNINISAICIGY